jgi:8-oxo-dGTP diphosphatase
VTERIADGVVQAAGGIVWRPTAGDGTGDSTSTAGGTSSVELLVIHRPRYDDWGWPKGKAEAADVDHEANARREVFEETGFSCALERSLGEVHYIARGKPKTVRYWAMTVTDGEFTPNAEVDEVAWLAPEAARERLSYDVDREILDRFLA